MNIEEKLATPFPQKKEFTKKSLRFQEEKFQVLIHGLALP